MLRSCAVRTTCPRWKYVLWKMGAGILLLLVPVAFLSVGTFVAAATIREVVDLDLEEGFVELLRSSRPNPTRG